MRAIEYLEHGERTPSDDIISRLDDLEKTIAKQNEIIVKLRCDIDCYYYRTQSIMRHFNIDMGILEDGGMVND